MKSKNVLLGILGGTALYLPYILVCNFEFMELTINQYIILGCICLLISGAIIISISVWKNPSSKNAIIRSLIMLGSLAILAFVSCVGVEPTVGRIFQAELGEMSGYQSGIDRGLFLYAIVGECVFINIGIAVCRVVLRVIKDNKDKKNARGKFD